MPSYPIPIEYAQGSIVLIIVLAIFVLSALVPSLMAIDDDYEVLKKNWTTYAWLIIMSIIFFIIGLGSIAALAASFKYAPQYPNIICTI